MDLYLKENEHIRR